MKRPCLEPGCPHAGTPRCAVHARERERARGSSTERGYGSTEHLAWRRAVLLRDRSCRDCGAPLVDAQGEPLPTAHADHIVRVRAGGQWELPNGAGRCDRCHGRKTRRECA